MASSSSPGDFWFWYSRQIRDLLPAWQRAAAAPGDALVAEAVAPDGDIVLWRRVRGHESRLGSARSSDLALLLAGQPDRLPLSLRLPEDLLLERSVVLPLAAEQDPAAALALNFDTLTPFTASEVFWTFETVRRETRNDLLHVRLSLLHRAAVADTIAALATAGRAPVLAEFGPPGAVSRLLPLGREMNRRARIRRVLTPALAGLAAGAALSLLVQPAIRTMLRANAIEAEIEALQPRLARAQSLRASLDAVTAGLDVLAAERRRVGNILPVLAQLTGALPDDASLTELSISQRHLVLSGEAAGAANVLLAMSANPDLSAVAFAAPVTHAASGGKDVFTIEAQASR